MDTSTKRTVSIITATQALIWAVSLFLLVPTALTLPADFQTQDNCAAIYPSPVIRYDHTDAEGRVYIPVDNWSAYPDVMFRRAPDLPPAGTNTSASRTWVEIYNADNNARLYGFVGFSSGADLKTIWFKPPTPNGRVYIIMNDRACSRTYKSNIVTY